jgi:hypothetical protein
MEHNKIGITTAKIALTYTISNFEWENAQSKLVRVD